MNSYYCRNSHFFFQKPTANSNYPLAETNIQSSFDQWEKTKKTKGRKLKVRRLKVYFWAAIPAFRSYSAVFKKVPYGRSLSSLNGQPSLLPIPHFFHPTEYHCNQGRGIKHQTSLSNRKRKPKVQTFNSLNIQAYKVHF